MKIKQESRGFTLVELMIVITVIAILATIAVVSFSRVQKQARDTKRKGDLRALATALQAYFTEKNTYPAAASWTSELVPTYIPVMPVNPAGDTLVPTYTYSLNTGTNDFVLCVGQEAVAGALSYWNVTSKNTGGYLASACATP